MSGAHAHHARADEPERIASSRTRSWHSLITFLLMRHRRQCRLVRRDTDRVPFVCQVTREDAMRCFRPEAPRLVASAVAAERVSRGFAVAGAASCPEYAGRAEQRRSDPGLPGCHGCRPAWAMQGHGGKVSLATWSAAVSDWRPGKRPAIADIPGTTMTLTPEYGEEERMRQQSEGLKQRAAGGLPQDHADPPEHKRPQHAREAPDTS